MTRTWIIFVAAVLACSALVAQSEQTGKTLPVPIYKPEPAYTEEARAAKISGSVMVQAIIDAECIPSEMRVVKSLDPGLDQNALEAVGKWRFRPATQDGTAVSIQVTIEIGFKLI